MAQAIAACSTAAVAAGAPVARKAPVQKPSTSVLRSKTAKSVQVQRKSFRPSRCVAHSVNAATATTEGIDLAVKITEEEEESGPGLSTQQVKNLLSLLCEETDVMELKLKIGGFRLHAKRSLEHKLAALPPPPPPAAAAPAPVVSAPAAPAPPPPATFTPPPAQEDADEDLVDEGLIGVTSEKVGVMRRGRMVKGKSGRPLTNEGDYVKKNQTLCFVEQLGTQVAIEAPVDGEIVHFLIEDSDLVQFGQVVVEIRPDFPGIKGRR